MAKNRNEIGVRGGELRYREIYPTPDNNWTVIGFTRGLTVFNEHGIVRSLEDLGSLANVQSGSEEIHLEFNLLQSSKTLIDFIRGAIDKGFEFWLGAYTLGGVAQSVLFPCSKMEPGWQAPFGPATERVIPLRVWALAPIAALTRTPTDYNTAIRVPLVVASGANADEPPSDNASVAAAGWSA